MHTFMCIIFGVESIILPQTIMNMEKSGGLSSVLKQKIADTNVAIVGSVAVELIADAISRLGFVDIVSVPDSTDLPICDVVICTCTEKSDCSVVFTHYNDVSVICAYNFCIGACAVILLPNNELPFLLRTRLTAILLKRCLTIQAVTANSGTYPATIGLMMLLNG